jgi:enterochelin esterase-like enzyme
VLARAADPARTPYLFLSCGDQEGLLPANRNFAALLESHHFRYEFHVVPGGHDWNQWNQRLPGLFESLGKRLVPNSSLWKTDSWQLFFPHSLPEKLLP